MTKKWVWGELTVLLSTEMQWQCDASLVPCFSDQSLSFQQDTSFLSPSNSFQYFKAKKSGRWFRLCQHSTRFGTVRSELKFIVTICLHLHFRHALIVYWRWWLRWTWEIILLPSYNLLYLVHSIYKERILTSAFQINSDLQAISRVEDSLQQISQVRQKQVEESRSVLRGTSLLR